jgi:hypothetical protein
MATPASRRPTAPREADESPRCARRKHRRKAPGKRRGISGAASPGNDLPAPRSAVAGQMHLAVARTRRSTTR